MEAKALLDKLIKRTGLEATHIGTLKKLESAMAPMASEIALAFYDYLGRDEEMHAILWDVPGRVERLYGKFAQWYREIFSGDYDEAYAQRRVRLGLIHAYVGVRPSHIMPAMGIVQELSLEHLRNVFRSGNIYAAIEAFEKILSIELALMQESYLMAMQEGARLGLSSSDTAMIEGAKALLAQG